MFWIGTHVGGANVLAVAATGLLFLALLVGTALLGLQDRPASPPGPPAGPEPPGGPEPFPWSRPSPEQVLAERFARGEIDATDYRHRLATLARHRRHRPTHPAGRGAPR
jgi:putative membrane protein